jgi:hypothetical protein
MVQIVPSIIVEVVATVSGVVISVGIPLILTKLNKINKLYTTVFGIEEVSTVDGLVDSVDEHEVELKSIKESNSSIEARIDTIEESHEELKNKLDVIHEQLDN